MISPATSTPGVGQNGEPLRVLIVDDEQSMREWMRILFQRDGFQVFLAEDGVAGRDLITREYVDVVLTDIRMPRMDGIALLKAAHDIAPDAIVCMMTAHFSRDSEEWRRAREHGAAALFEKPFRDVHLVTLQVRQLIDARRVRHERDVLRQAITSRGFVGIVGRSSKMLDVFRLVETVCRTNSTILITGESGTGKELVARAIHTQSLRRDHPFVAVNCGGLPETLLESELFGHMRGAFTGADSNKKGLIEVADKGTIFLDEIGEMSAPMQVKLLRVLQERKYRRVGDTDEIAANIRVIAATNRDLAKMVGDGGFREDLFYRLNVIPIRLPALRERAEDVSLVAEHFLAKFTREMAKPLEGITPEAMALLTAYQWPGNVRELENVVERAVALETSDRVRAETLGDHLRDNRPATPMGERSTGQAFPAPGFNLEEHLQDIERSHVERALRQASGVQVRAAELLGLSFRQFRYLVKKHTLKI
ncbi:MAG: sigma-54-dependent Fis family transcriptional regulator [Acidobacteria bacterium]|nr:sigma-54-dependent Fis family transcriptional regulator [Acidobacteriota bacterium]